MKIKLRTLFVMFSLIFSVFFINIEIMEENNGLYYNKNDDNNNTNDFTDDNTNEDIVNIYDSFPEIIGIKASSANFPLFTTEISEDIDFNRNFVDDLGIKIINSISTGDFFKHNWMPDLQSTYRSLKILESIDMISSVNSVMISNYILNCYVNDTGLFFDGQTGFINFSLYDTRIGYSAVLSTSYAVLCLQLLGKLHLISIGDKSIIFSNIIAAINPIDGGFCRRIDGITPNEQESSSLRLSYFCYFALDALSDVGILTSDQINALAVFVSSLQGKNPSYISTHGGFWDNLYYSEGGIEAHSDMEITYYAVELMNAIGKVDLIDKNKLITFLNFMHDSGTGGIYYGLWSKFFPLITPEYFASACALGIQEIADITTNIDKTNAEQYIYSGFNNTYGGWNLYSEGPSNYNHILSYTYLTIISLKSSGFSFPPSLKNLIALGLSNYTIPLILYEDNYATAFCGFPKSYGSISEMYEKVKFLNKVGLIDTLTIQDKESILKTIEECYYENSTGESMSFSEIPKYSLDIFNGNYLEKIPFELDWINYNFSQNSLHGLKGIYKTNKVLKIAENLDLMDNLTSKFDLNLFAEEILNCQITSNYKSKGGFMPCSKTNLLLDSYPDYEKKYCSPILAFEAVESLKIIDDFLGTDYLDQCDKNALKDYLVGLQVSNSTILFYSDIDSYKIDSIQFWDNKIWNYNNKITETIIKTDRIADLDITTVPNQMKHFEYLNMNPDRNIAGSIEKLENMVKSLLLENNLIFHNEDPLDLQNYLSVFGLLFGSNSLFHYLDNLAINEMKFINNLLEEPFISIYFNQPDINYDFGADIYFRVSSIIDHNRDNHEVSLKPLDASQQGNWFISNNEGAQYKCEITDTFTLEHYPFFNITVSDQFPLYKWPKSYTYCMNSSINTNYDFSLIEDNIWYDKGDILEYSFGSSLKSNDPSEMLHSIPNLIIETNVYDKQNDLLGDESSWWITISSEVVFGGENWTHIQIDTIPFEYNFTLNISITDENNLFVENSTILFDPSIEMFRNESKIEIKLDINYNVPPPVIPDPPEITTENSTIEFDNITISWTEISEVDFYNIYVNDTLNSTTTETSQNIMLLNNGSYSITVTSVKESMESIKSDPITIKVCIPPDPPDIPQVPDPPEILTQNCTIKYNNITIFWTEIDEIEFYNIYVNNTINATTTSISQNLMLWNNGSYIITVTSVNNSLESIRSNAITINISISPEDLVIPEVPGPPELLNQNNTIEFNNITISWTEISEVDFYNIYINDTLNVTTTLTSQNLMLWNNGSYIITITSVRDSLESIKSDPVLINVVLLTEIPDEESEEEGEEEEEEESSNPSENESNDPDNINNSNFNGTNESIQYYTIGSGIGLVLAGISILIVGNKRKKANKIFPNSIN